MFVRFCAGVLVVGITMAGCGSSDTAANESDAGTPREDAAIPASDASNDASSDASGVDGAAQGAPGSCLAPRDITVGFVEAASASTAGQLDVTAVACGAPANIPEVVYRLTLAQPTTVNIKASDHSGQGVGVQLRQDSCTGTSVGCDWEGGGNVLRAFALPAGTWFIILERKPTGAFTLSILP